MDKIKKLFRIQLVQAVWLVPFALRLVAPGDLMEKLPAVLDWFGMFAGFVVMVGVVTGALGMKRYKQLIADGGSGKLLNIAKWLTIVNMIAGGIMVGMVLLVIFGLAVLGLGN